MRLVRRSSRTDQPALTETEGHTLAAVTGEEQGFAAVYELVFPRLCAYAERFLDRDGARDAVQDALVDIWSRWAGLAAEGLPAAFFFGAVRNRVATARV